MSTGEDFEKFIEVVLNVGGKVALKNPVQTLCKGFKYMWNGAAVEAKDDVAELLIVPSESPKIPLMEASSAMASLTEVPLGHERWWIQRIFVDRFRVTASRCEQRKFVNGVQQWSRGIKGGPRILAGLGGGFITCETAERTRSNGVVCDEPRTAAEGSVSKWWCGDGTDGRVEPHVPAATVEGAAMVNTGSGSGGQPKVCGRLPGSSRGGLGRGNRVNEALLVLPRSYVASARWTDVVRTQGAQGGGGDPDEHRELRGLGLEHEMNDVCSCERDSGSLRESATACERRWVMLYD
ncbi:hypothetical protein B0H19DRAFT_1063290 [Mycena capillaripes]|nr:hypothetical protein B0H19DRAFT_1063290 [Mycena capillaripes]